MNRLLALLFIISTSLSSECSPKRSRSPRDVVSDLFEPEATSLQQQKRARYLTTFIILANSIHGPCNELRNQEDSPRQNQYEANKNLDLNFIIILEDNKK